MPIYVHRCKTCEKQVEKLMKVSDPAPTCEEHGSMEKVIQSSWKFTFTNGKGTDGGHTIR